MQTADEKAKLRERMAARRDTVHEDRGPALRDQFERHVLPLIEASGGSVVSAFWPMGSEANVRPIMDLLEERGFSLALPVVAAKGKPLRFRRWQHGAAMDRGVWDIPIPADTTELIPDILLVPLLAFDLNGYRLGYGGGFYDRTLAELESLGNKPLAIGIALDLQKVEHVPHAEYDKRLDGFLTEAGFYATEREPA